MWLQTKCGVLQAQISFPWLLVFPAHAGEHGCAVQSGLQGQTCFSCRQGAHKLGSSVASHHGEVKGMHVGDPSRSAKATCVGVQGERGVSSSSQPSVPLYSCHALVEIVTCLWDTVPEKKVSQMCSVGSCGVPGTRIPLAGCCRQQSVNLQCVNLTSPHREVNQPGSVPCSGTLLIALKRLRHSVLGPNSSGFSHLFDSYITKSCNLSL